MALIFERNSPALSKGFLTYQFCGLAFWCEEMVDLITASRAYEANVAVVNATKTLVSRALDIGRG